MCLRQLCSLLDLYLCVPESQTIPDIVVHVGWVCMVQMQGEYLIFRFGFRLRASSREPSFFLASVWIGRCRPQAIIGMFFQASTVFAPSRRSSHVSHRSVPTVPAKRGRCRTWDRVDVRLSGRRSTHSYKCDGLLQLHWGGCGFEKRLIRCGSGY